MSTSLKLLKEKRFSPFFQTQFLGAFNDNLFKNALAILLAYRAVSETEGGFWINLASGLFILPFFLFSPLAGQLCDKYEKTKIIRIIKFAEIVFMLLAAIGFWRDDKYLLLFVLFGMGTHSTFFGPVKYSILPLILKPSELISGNAMIELGTFLAILLGTIGGGLLVGYDVKMAAIAVVLTAIVGFITAQFISPLPIADSKLKINLNFVKETRVLSQLAKSDKTIRYCIWGISWFWFYGATILSQIPNFTKYFIGGNESVGTLYLTVFSLSIGIGSFLCEKLSKGEIELGIVPIGAFGMSAFVFDLFLINYGSPAATLISARDYFANMSWTHARILFDLAMIGISVSLFMIPLYALIQKRGNPAYQSRLIAWLNLHNSIFMVASAVTCMVLYKLNFSTTQIFGVVAVLNLIICTYVFLLIPEFLFRFGFWFLTHTIYRVKIDGQDNIPIDGPALLVSNHVTFIDWMIVTAACRRPVRFTMDHNYYFHPLLKWFFKLAKTIPIAEAKESVEIKEKAFGLVSEELKQGQLVCIFPEGGITRTGELHPFKKGVERILAQDPVPVIPVAIKGLWGSYFSRHLGSAMSGLPRFKRRSIAIHVGSKQPSSSSASSLQVVIQNML